MSVVVADLGELLASGIQAVVCNDGGVFTVYVHEGLSEDERAVEVARLDAACVQLALAGRFQHPVTTSTTADGADRFVARLVEAFEPVDPAGAAALAAIDGIVARETAAPYLRVLVAEQAARLTGAVLATLTDGRQTESAAFELLAASAKWIKDEVGYTKWTAPATASGRRQIVA